MILAQFNLYDLDCMTVAEIKEMFKDMPDEAKLNLIPAITMAILNILKSHTIKRTTNK